jgi:hypothetical protein
MSCLQTERNEMGKRRGEEVNKRCGKSATEKSKHRKKDTTYRRVKQVGEQTLMSGYLFTSYFTPLQGNMSERSNVEQQQQQPTKNC